MKRTFLSTFLPFFLIILLGLTGCVRYDVEIQFLEQHRGEIIQNIQLGQQLTSLSGLEARKWLESIESRAKQLKGSVKHLSDSEMQVTIPFSNGQEMVEKFNHFFNPTADQTQGKAKDNINLLPLKAEMDLDQSNWLLFERNRLDLTVDLQGLGVLSQQGNVILSPGDLIDLKFGLNSPLGAKALSNETAETLIGINQGRQVTWKLQPGQINHLETVFWVPSYLAWGTIALIFFCIMGYLLKHRQFPGVSSAV